MAQKIVVYWRDIPSQVIISKGRSKGKRLLSQRFHEAIDQAAMYAGLAGSDDYVAEWRREASDYDCDETLEVCAVHEAELLETAFSDELLQKVTKNKGLMPSA